MRVIGFNFRKFTAERKKDIKGKIEIKTNMDIENIEKDTLDFAGDLLRFSFIYEIDYAPGHAKITFEGSVLVKTDKKEDLVRVINDWKKNKVSEETKLLVFNFVMAKCNLKALQLEEEFSLPPHIPLPKLAPPEKSNKDTNYAG